MKRATHSNKMPMVATGKRVYQTPHLAILGAILALTASGSGAMTENMFNMGTNRML